MYLCCGFMAATCLSNRSFFETGFEHCRLAFRGRRGHQALSVMKRQLMGGAFRVIVVERSQWIPAIQRDREKHIAPVRDRVAAHKVIHGQRGNAHTDSDGYGGDHQR